MKRSRNIRKYTKSEEASDDRVVAEADDDSAWGPPVSVPSVRREVLLRLPTAFARQMELRARLEGFSSLEDWLVHTVTSQVKGQAKPGSVSGADKRPRSTAPRRAASPKTQLPRKQTR